MTTAAVEHDGAIVCPYCGDNVPSLVPIETGMRLRLQETGSIGTIPEQVCDGCLKMLSKMVSKGAVLRAEQQAKEQNRILLWRNRVQLVKQAKTHLAQKNFSDAAVAYEKYLRVLEIVYEVEPGKLSPEHFKSQARAQEMTVITSVYWDLMRIYDTHNTYRERQFKAADKLAEFVRFTPIFPHIMRKAESNTRTAKNPEAFNKFLKKSNASRPRCFIATAAFDGYHHPVITTLTQFRDETLRQRPLGRKLVWAYYRVSPSLARILDLAPALKPLVRLALSVIASSLSKSREFNRRDLD